MSIFQNHYFILFFVSLITGNYMYIFDIPQALSTKLQQSPYQYSLYKINLLYTFTSIGVVIFIFQLGFIYDKVRLQITLIVIPVVIFASQLLLTLMFQFYGPWSYYIIIVARIVFGIAGQSTFILLAVVCARLYKKQSGKYIGYGNVVGILGQPLNAVLTPFLVTVFGNIILPMYFGTGIAFAYIFIGFILVKIINHSQKNVTTKDQQALILIQNKNTNQNIGMISQLKQLNKQFWVLLAFIFLELAAVGGFISNGIDYLVKRYNVNYDISGRLFLIPVVMGSLSSIIFWGRINISLRNCFLLVSLTLLLPHIAFYFLPTRSGPVDTASYILYILVLVLLGINSGGYNVKLIPAVYIITKPQFAGMIGGLIGLAIHITILLIPFLSSVIVSSFSDQTQGYKRLSLCLFIPLGALSCCLAIYVRISKDFDTLDHIDREKIDKSRSGAMY